MKRFLSLALAVIMVIACTVVCFSHQGRTDSQGGHYVQSTGEYHYHHGRPVHFHPNGICPYSSAEQHEDTSATNNDQTKILDVVFCIFFFIGGFIFLVYIFRDCPMILEFLFIPVLLPIALLLTIIRKIKEKIFPSQQSSLFDKPEKKISKKAEKKQRPSFSSPKTPRSFEQFCIIALIIMLAVLISPILIIVFTSLFAGNPHYKP